MRLAGLLLALLGVLALVPAGRPAAAPACGVDRPVRFAGLDWASNRFHTALAAFILEHGYGCETETVPGTTIPLLTGLGRGDLDIMMEVWKDQLTEAWAKAEEAGTVKSLGVNFPDAVQGWYVPRYVVEGEDAPAKGLEHVDDLPRYKDLFADPEEPGKGRFYNCKLGWDCEQVNTKKLRAYGLEDHFTNFRPGSGAALDAAIASAHEREKPILYYHWSPTRISAKYDAVKLEEPAYDAAVWARMMAAEKPERATAYPVVAVHKAVNTDFAESAPAVTEFLRNYRTTNRLISEALRRMEKNEADGAAGAARHFLRERADMWSQWVPEDAARRVNAALKRR